MSDVAFAILMGSLAIYLGCWRICDAIDKLRDSVMVMDANGDETRQ